MTEDSSHAAADGFLGCFVFCFMQVLASTDDEVSDRSLPPLTLALSMSESTCFGSLRRLVRSRSVSR